jgi:diguanylate cyclase (GGDEF)-like protein/PAS domain S-box-containing protein
MYTMSPIDKEQGVSLAEPTRDEDLLRMFRELPDAVVVIDSAGDLVWGNSTAERLFGTTIREAAGLSGLEYVHPEDLPFVLLSLDSIQEKEVGSPIEIRLRTPTGWHLLELVGTPVPWLGDRSVLLVLRDLTERRRYEVSHNRDARFRAVVQNAAVVTMLVAEDGTVLSCSGAMSRMLGHDPELVEGRPLVNLATGDDRGAVMGAIVRASHNSASAPPVTVTVGLTKKGAESPIPFELGIVNLVDDPTVGGYVITGHDVTDRKRLEHELSYQAFHDSLTGLGNRSLFLDRLGHSLQRTERNNDRIAALFLDMDGLKSANDRLGHAAGDQLLQSMAKVLLGCIRRSDTAARLGGDEFGVIVEEFTYQREVEALADRILAACRAPFAVEGHELSGTVSIGFAFSRRGITVDELMSNADRAMYTAKNRGKDRAECFEDWMLTAGSQPG